jgi:hypothetical protein
MKLSIKERRAGAVNVYAVTLTVHVHAQSAADAGSYIESAIAEWAAHGRKIPSILIQSVLESPIRYHIEGVTYPTEKEQA